MAPGNGGTGITSSISGSAIQYAGGGGGSWGNGGPFGIGAAGGGNGDNGSSNTTTSGLANTGGGGGASYGATSGAGGSGIVIIRYPSYLAPATSTTGSPRTYIAGSWRVYVWVSSGTITF